MGDGPFLPLMLLLRYLGGMLKAAAGHIRGGGAGTNKKQPEQSKEQLA
jgi:hypothetical protein